jgi:uncharacterized protein with PIN domain
MLRLYAFSTKALPQNLNQANTRFQKSGLFIVLTRDHVLIAQVRAYTLKAQTFNILV